MTKSWSLSVANAAVASAVVACVWMTQSPWLLLGLLLIPLNLVAWQYTTDGIMVVAYEEDDDIEVTVGDDDRLQIVVDAVGKKK